MKFGLVGDTHNNLKSIENICDIFNENDVEFVIHTGDITLPKSLDLFKKLKMPLLGVFGNNDQEEKESLKEICKKRGFSFSDELKIKFSNNKFIYAIHDPLDIKDNFYASGNIIVHGHTHRFRDENVNESFIFNPGECAGMMKGLNQVGIIDTEMPKMDIFKF